MSLGYWQERVSRHVPTCQYASPFVLSAIWARAHIADTPSALAYVLATKSSLAPLGKGDLEDRGCAHTARVFIRLLPHVHPINGLAFPENWGSARK